MLTIRQALDEELDDVAEVLARAYEEYGPDEADPPDMVARWAEYKEEIRDVRSRLEGAELIVAEADGKLVGAVSFYLPGFYPFGDWPDDAAGIRLLGVDPSARGLGVGHALTDWCMQRARELGARWFVLHTTHLMNVARGMYERMGFERADKNDFVVAETLHVLAYRKPLDA